jgi:hypothetical protein
MCSFIRIYSDGIRTLQLGILVPVSLEKKAKTLVMLCLFEIA